MGHRLAVDHEVTGEFAQRGDDGDELDRPVAAVAAPQLHPVAFLAREEAIAAVLQLVNPVLTGRDLLGDDGLSGANETRRSAPVTGKRGTHQHRRPVTYALSRVPETVWRNDQVPSLAATLKPPPGEACCTPVDRKRLDDLRPPQARAAARSLAHGLPVSTGPGIAGVRAERGPGRRARP